MKQRIKDYLNKQTMTNLVLLIDHAQSVGGIRSFHHPTLGVLIKGVHAPVTQFLSDPDQPRAINEHGWGNASLAESYFWLVDYETGKVTEG